MKNKGSMEGGIHTWTNSWGLPTSPGILWVRHTLSRTRIFFGCSHMSVVPSEDSVEIWENFPLGLVHEASLLILLNYHHPNTNTTKCVCQSKPKWLLKTVAGGQNLISHLILHNFPEGPNLGKEWRKHVQTIYLTKR